MNSDKDAVRAYAIANEFIKEMRICYNQHLLTSRQVKMIKRQALSGDIVGARKKLRKIIERVRT